MTGVLEPGVTHEKASQDFLCDTHGSVAKGWILTVPERLCTEP